MLLFNFVGLIVTLTAVSGDCDVGTQGVKRVNFAKTVGTWYVLWHTPNDFENNFDCVVATYASAKGNVSTVTLEAYDISAQSYVTLYGNVSNWTSNTMEEIFQQPTIWSGRYYVIAVDYKSYVILKLCSLQSNQLYVYVAFRSKHPDNATIHHAKNELRKNKIDDKQLVEWKADHCQRAQSATEGRSTA